MQPTRGLLLINLGSPAAPTVPAVRSYLKEFLSDPRVMDIPFFVRQMILRLFILPKRPPKVAPKYALIWGESESPLIEHSKASAAAVKAKLGDGWTVELAMRYGGPSIEQAMERFAQAKVSELVILPLFPQYASATTGSAMEKILGLLGGWKTIPSLRTIHHFFDHPSLVQCFADRGRPLLSPKVDHIVFSFHGLPVRQIQESDTTKTCLTSDHCCDADGAKSGCYKAQCLATAQAIATALELGQPQWSVAFQSRLGKEEWIGPSFDGELIRLAKEGRKHLLVYSPSFVADCLETLEEIAIGGKEIFLAHGGESLELVPSLNQGEDWAQAIVDIVSV